MIWSALVTVALFTLAGGIIVSGFARHSRGESIVPNVLAYAASMACFVAFTAKMLMALFTTVLSYEKDFIYYPPGSTLGPSSIFSMLSCMFSVGFVLFAQVTLFVFFHSIARYACGHRDRETVGAIANTTKILTTVGALGALAYAVAL